MEPGKYKPPGPIAAYFDGPVIEILPSVVCGFLTPDTSTVSPVGHCPRKGKDEPRAF